MIFRLLILHRAFARTGFLVRVRRAERMPAGKNDRFLLPYLSFPPPRPRQCAGRESARPPGPLSSKHPRPVLLPGTGRVRASLKVRRTSFRLEFTRSFDALIWRYLSTDRGPSMDCTRAISRRLECVPYAGASVAGVKPTTTQNFGKQNNGKTRSRFGEVWTPCSKCDCGVMRSPASVPRPSNETRANSRPAFASDAVAHRVLSGDHTAPPSPTPRRGAFCGAAPQPARNKQKPNLEEKRND